MYGLLPFVFFLNVNRTMVKIDLSSIHSKKQLTAVGEYNLN